MIREREKERKSAQATASGSTEHPSFLPCCLCESKKWSTLIHLKETHSLTHSSLVSAKKKEEIETDKERHPLHKFFRMKVSLTLSSNTCSKCYCSRFNTSRVDVFSLAIVITHIYTQVFMGTIWLAVSPASFTFSLSRAVCLAFPLHFNDCTSCTTFSARGWCHWFFLLLLLLLLSLFYSPRANDDCESLEWEFARLPLLLLLVSPGTLFPSPRATSYSLPVSSSFHQKTKCEHTKCSFYSYRVLFFLLLLASFRGLLLCSLAPLSLLKWNLQWDAASERNKATMNHWSNCKDKWSKRTESHMKTGRIGERRRSNGESERERKQVKSEKNNGSMRKSIFDRCLRAFSCAVIWCDEVFRVSLHHSSPSTYNEMLFAGVVDSRRAQLVSPFYFFYSSSSIHPQLISLWPQLHFWVRDAWMHQQRVWRQGENEGWTMNAIDKIASKRPSIKIYNEL